MGASHARGIVAEGGKVVIGDVLDDEGRALADELGDAVRFVHLDVTRPEDWDAAVRTAEEEFGPVTPAHQQRRDRVVLEHRGHRPCGVPQG
ncbi:MAG: hypothetical protein KatS3mg011_2086 [Acidimicrobiia bacterium]|nr:MAG: hypothetical protein KatS3mg011_2086 [Acidimicrobiia bacterium]